MKCNKKLNREDLLKIIEEIIKESRRFPLLKDFIIKETTRRAYPQTSSQMESLLSSIKDCGSIIVFNGSQQEEFFHRSNLDKLEARILDKIRIFHQKFPGKRGVVKSELRKILFPNNSGNNQKIIDNRILEMTLERALSNGKLKMSDQMYYVSEFKPSDKPAEIELIYQRRNLTIRSFFERNPYIKLDPDELSRQLGMKKKEIIFHLNALRKSKELFLLEPDRYITDEYLTTIKNQLSEIFIENNSMYITEIAEALGMSRKSISPIIHYLDRIGFTVREGDYRRKA